MWQLAQTGLARCCCMRSRSVVGFAASFSASGGTFGGGGGGGVPSRFSRTHLPRSTTDVRFAYEVDRQDARLSQDTAALIAGQRHPSESAAVHALRCRSAGPAARSDTCSWRRAAPGSADRRAPGSGRRARFRVTIALRSVSLKPANSAASGACVGDVSHLQPLADEIVHEPRSALVGQHPAHLPLKASPVRSWFFAARSINSSSGMLLHRKNDNRDASSRSLIS